MTLVGVVLALAVGLVLGLLGGGGSILAVPIFLYVFHVPPKPAIAMSLVVVGMSALVGFLTHWRQDTVNVRIAVLFGVLAMVGRVRRRPRRALRTCACAAHAVRARSRSPPRS